MKVLELMHKLEEAYDRFGDIQITADIGFTTIFYRDIKDVVIESDEIILVIDKAKHYDAA